MTVEGRLRPEEPVARSPIAFEFGPDALRHRDFRSPTSNNRAGACGGKAALLRESCLLRHGPAACRPRQLFSVLAAGSPLLPAALPQGFRGRHAGCESLDPACLCRLLLRPLCVDPRNQLAPSWDHGGSCLCFVSFLCSILFQSFDGISRCGLPPGCRLLDYPGDSKTIVPGFRGARAVSGRTLVGAT